VSPQNSPVESPRGHHTQSEHSPHNSTPFMMEIKSGDENYKSVPTQDSVADYAKGYDHQYQNND